MKLLLDEMLDASIAQELRKRGYDLAAIQGDATLEGEGDVDVLGAATQQDRALVTNNVEDFIHLHRRLLSDGEEHAGVILASSRSLPRSKRTVGLWIDTLVRYLDANPTTSLRNARGLLSAEALTKLVSLRFNQTFGSQQRSQFATCSPR